MILALVAVAFLCATVITVVALLRGGLDSILRFERDRLKSHETSVLDGKIAKLTGEVAKLDDRLSKDQLGRMGR